MLRRQPQQPLSTDRHSDSPASQSQTQRFEGATIEEALNNVRAACGSGARIVAAEKVRSGGVAGFFAQERIEVTVEVDGPAAMAEPAPTRVAQPVPSPAFAPAMNLLDLADSVSDAEYAGSATVAASATTVSTDSSSFAAVLRRIASEAELAVAAQTAGDPPPVVVPAPAAPAADDEFDAEASDSSTNRALAAFTALARRNPSKPEAVDAPAILTEDAVEPLIEEPALVPHVTDPQVIDPQVIDMITEEVVHPAPVDANNEVVAPATGRALEPVPVSMALSPLAKDLQRLGLPGPLLPASLDGNLFEALVTRLEQLPGVPSLPRAKGTVLAVVGPLEQAMEVARELAVDARTHPREIVICEPDDSGRGRPVRAGRRRSDLPGHLRLTGIDEAEEHRRGWRRRLEPTVVVIDAAVTPADATWARDVVSVLEPHSVWGVVDGGRKIEDLAAWSEDLGGLDALAVTGVAETLTPASVLHLGLPVGLVDGEPASPMLWAELLLDRVAA